MSYSEKDSGNAPLGDSYEEQWKALSAWFLGPKAENWDTFIETFNEVFQEHIRLRNNYFPSDPAYITDEMKSSAAYYSEVRDMEKQLLEMQDQLQGCVPFFSPRYQGHMNWDVTMPAILGYMGAMLFNQNNVDSAASPVTTSYEKEVGLQLCDMLGYNVRDEKRPLAWGHVTCGGSISNIEALWASRNIKFVPLALKAVLMNKDPKDGPLAFISEDQILKGLGFEVNAYNKVTDKIELIPLVRCSNWQLLNLDIDEICDLVTNVIDAMEKIEDKVQIVDRVRFGVLVEKEGVMSIGVYNFLEKHGLEHAPVYTAPANFHYSWPKAGTVLGLGSNTLIPIQLDRDFRQDVKDLKKKLEGLLENEIPVLSVIAVMGSTEESAVDPIKEIYELREHLKAKGLNFAILADGAWGGYFKTMLIEKAEDKRIGSDGFMPYCELSPYVAMQYEHIQYADTITMDPHKSGFCPYPGGSLCYRNGKMRFPIARFHPEVFDGGDNSTMGVYGIEGSKPGAAPAGILMSHNVIGLSNRGYGRILGQCTATTKLFYAMWLTLARDDDPFVCVPLQDIPKDYTMNQVKVMIRDKIAFKPIKDVYSDEQVTKFLTECGPDTMINTFVVNFRNNEDVELANELQVALSDAMNIYVGSNPNRIPLMVMQSVMDAEKHGEALRYLKCKAGLFNEDDKNLNVMVNTSMNPWQSNESIFTIGDLFRSIVFNCIGRVKDAAFNHTFLLSGSSVGIESIFIEYITGSDDPEHLYQVSVKVEADDEYKATVSKYIDYCKKNHRDVLFESNMSDYDEKDSVPNLYNILHSSTWDKRIRVRLINDPKNSKVSLKVLDIPRYQCLDLSSSTTYPPKMKYFIYGDSTRIIMSHVISKLPDYQHTVILSQRPHSLTETMLEQGLIIEVEGDDETAEPLVKSSYDISFKGELHATIHTTINIKKRLWYKKISFPHA